MHLKYIFWVAFIKDFSNDVFIEFNTINSVFSIQFLFDHSCYIWFFYFHVSTLYLAVQTNNIEIVKLILENIKTSINLQCIFIEIILIKHNFKYKLSNYCNLNLYIIFIFIVTETILHIAVKNNNVELVKLLLQQKNIEITNDYMILNQI